MLITNEIFILRAPVDSLALGPWIAFGQGDLGAFADGGEVRSRLMLARQEPVAMPRLRVAFERWRLSDAVFMDDEHLIEQISADVRTSRLAAILLRNAEADLRPGTQAVTVKHLLARTESASMPIGGMPAEVRLAEVLRRAVKIGQENNRSGRWERLIERDATVRNISVLTAWTRNWSRGPAAVAEAFHVAKGAYVESLPLFAAAAELYKLLGVIGTARTEKLLDDAANTLVRLVRTVGVDGFHDILHLASTRGTEGIDPRPLPRDTDRRPREPVQRTPLPKAAETGAPKPDAPPPPAGSGSAAGSGPPAASSQPAPPGGNGPSPPPPPAADNAGAGQSLADQAAQAVKEKAAEVAKDPCAHLAEMLDKVQAQRVKADEMLREAEQKRDATKKAAQEYGGSDLSSNEHVQDLAKAEAEYAKRKEQMADLEKKLDQARKVLEQCRQAAG